MILNVTEIQSSFVGRVDGVDLRKPTDNGTTAEIEDAISRLAILIFPTQSIDDEQQTVFSRNFGELQRQAANTAKPAGERINAYMTDASNLGKDNKAFEAGDKRRMNNLGSRRWHTDGSFKPIPAKYSLLSARAIPPIGGETQFADMRAAYDALSDEMKGLVDGLIVEHNLIFSRAAVGFPDATEEERAALPPVQQRLVRRHPVSGRKSLYLSSHASHVVGWPIPEGLDLLRELTEHATQPQFVYTHKWQLGDLVMWDNRVTMHRGRRHFPESAPRDMRRTSIDDVANTLEQAA
jgi:alpha-ketoglutarate-dependent 2,4-dichlorophenoxyacetate dioxygenase